MRLSAPIYRLKRQARMLSRADGITYLQALNRIARAEGFASWSLLANRVAHQRPGRRLSTELAPGDLLLIGARPGHGKTLLGQRLPGLADVRLPNPLDLALFHKACFLHDGEIDFSAIA